MERENVGGVGLNLEPTFFRQTIVDNTIVYATLLFNIFFFNYM